MKNFNSEVICSMREVLVDVYHEGWGFIFEGFFTCLADSNTVGFEKLVADAVTDYVCVDLSEEYAMTYKEIERVYALYADYADYFEKRVREHIKRKVNHSDLCEVA